MNHHSKYLAYALLVFVAAQTYSLLHRNLEVFPFSASFCLYHPKFGMEIPQKRKFSGCLELSRESAKEILVHSY